MKSLIQFLNKPETGSDDLAIIITGCTIFASIVIIILMAMGN